MTRLRWLAAASALALWVAPVAADEPKSAEARINWYDPTCRFFVVDLAEGYGLYEWKNGPEPKVDDAIVGDIAGGPELEATLRSSGEKVSLVHWGDAKNPEVLIRHSPDWCKSKRKKKN
jgi:hypothetical protein